MLNHVMKAAGVATIALSAAACGDAAPSGPSDPPSVSTTTTTTTSPPTSSTTTSSSTTSAPATQVVREASFESANGYTTQGSARILSSGGRYTLELGSDFRSSQSPALDVRLCNDTNCRGASLELGALRSFSGAQSYDLPNDGGAYSLVVIYCRAVQLAFGFGNLR